MRDARADHRQTERARERHPLVVERPSVDEQRVLLVAEAGAQLVHDPDPRADELDLGALGEPGQRHVVDREAERLAQRPRDRHQQRRARRQPAPERHVRFERQVEAAQRVPGLAQHPR